MSFNSSKNNGDVYERALLVSGYGLNEKFTFSYDHLAMPEGTAKKIDLKTSLSFATHAHLDIENKEQVIVFQNKPCPSWIEITRVTV